MIRGPLFWMLGLVAAQRLAELILASINTRRLFTRGAREVGRAHYPLFVVLHSSWLIAIAQVRQPLVDVVDVEGGDPHRLGALA